MNTNTIHACAAVRTRSFRLGLTALLVALLGLLLFVAGRPARAAEDIYLNLLHANGTIANSFQVSSFAWGVTNPNNPPAHPTNTVRLQQVDENGHHPFANIYNTYTSLPEITITLHHSAGQVVLTYHVWNVQIIGYTIFDNVETLVLSYQNVTETCN